MNVKAIIEIVEELADGAGTEITAAVGNRSVGLVSTPFDLGYAAGAAVNAVASRLGR